MYEKKQASIYPRLETNASGVVSVTYPAAATSSVMGVLLPTGGTMVQRQYGLECTGRIRILHQTAACDAGRRQPAANRLSLVRHQGRAGLRQSRDLSP